MIGANSNRYKADLENQFYRHAKFLRPEPNNVYSVRFVGPPMQYWLAFCRTGSNWYSVVIKDVETFTSNVQRNQFILERMIASYVFDQCDGNMRLLEMPLAVYGPVLEWANTVKKNPSAPAAPNFMFNFAETRWSNHHVYADNLSPMEQGPCSLGNIRHVSPLSYSRLVFPYDVLKVEAVGPDRQLTNEQIRLFKKATAIDSVITDLPRSAMREIESHSGWATLSSTRTLPCPECKGTRLLALFTSMAPCRSCDDNGSVPA